MTVLILHAKESFDRVQEVCGKFALAHYGVLVRETMASEWPPLPDGLSAVVVLEHPGLELLAILFELRKQFANCGTPIFVVPRSLNRNARTRLLAAGATFVCNPQETPERLVAEVQSCLDIKGSLTENAAKNLIQPVSAATIEALQVMGGIKARFKDLERRWNDPGTGDVSAVISLLGSVERMLTVTFPEGTARKLSIKFLGGLIDDPPEEMIVDCVAEMANIVAGQVKGRMVDTDYEFDTSTPSVVIGQNHEIRHRRDLPAYVVSFESEAGDFFIQLCIKERKPIATPKGG